MGGDEKTCLGLILLRNRCGASPFLAIFGRLTGCLALVRLCLDPRIKSDDEDDGLRWEMRVFYSRVLRWELWRRTPVVTQLSVILGQVLTETAIFSRWSLRPARSGQPKAQESRISPGHELRLIEEYCGDAALLLKLCK